MKRTLTIVLTVVILTALIAGCSKGKIEQPTKLDPKVAIEKRQEGANLIMKGDIKKAEEVLTQVKDSIPADSETHFLLGVTAYNRKDYNTAVNAYKEAIRLNANHFEAYNSMGNAYRDTKQYAEAEKSYRKAIELRPQFSFAYTNLALMLEANEPAKAIQVLQEGIKVFPGDMDMRYTLATVYASAGKTDEAKKTLEAILKDAPGYTAASDSLAELNKK